MAKTPGVKRRNGIVYLEDYSWREHVFKDRRSAGRVLGELLLEVVGTVHAVFGIAAGGVPVALEAADRLGSCLDIVFVKKITFPWTTEAGFGAVALDGTLEYDRLVAESMGFTGRVLEEMVRRALEAAKKRAALVRISTNYPSLKGMRVVVVDDGIATGYSMRVAVRFLRKRGAQVVVAAAPTASLEGAEFVAREADELVVANLRSGEVYAVADAYIEWYDVDDEELKSYLEEARRRKLLCPWIL
ncbi:MAG: phosphoribosyltransferase family protein [Pyrodictiaceae archaeon]